MRWSNLNIIELTVPELFEFEILTFSSNGSKMVQGHALQMHWLKDKRASKVATNCKVRNKN
jgi:hypothetical protein